MNGVIISPLLTNQFKLTHCVRWMHLASMPLKSH